MQKEACHKVRLIQERKMNISLGLGNKHNFYINELGWVNCNKLNLVSKFD